VKTHHVRHFHSHRICTARAIIFILFRHCLSQWILIRMRKRSSGPRFHGRVFHRCDVFSVVPSFFALCDGSSISKISELETRLVIALGGCTCCQKGTAGQTGFRCATIVKVWLKQLFPQTDLHGTACSVASEHPSKVVAWAFPSKSVCGKRWFCRAFTVVWSAASLNFFASDREFTNLFFT
jgi:hypothetical protein